MSNYQIYSAKSFKVIEVSTNRKPVWDLFLLEINSNWHPISYRFGVIAAYQGCNSRGDRGDI